MNVYAFGAGDPVNFSDPFGLSECPTEDSDERTACLERERKREEHFATCRADAKQLVTNATIHAMGLGALSAARSAYQLSRAAQATDAAVRAGNLSAAATSELAWTRAGQQFSYQAALLPGAIGTRIAANGQGGTENPFEDNLGIAYSLAKAIPYLSVVIDAGETIHSCYQAFNAP